MPKSSEMDVLPQTVDSGPREVKKHNNAIHVSGELSLIERKLVNVLLLNAFDNLAKQKTHTIPVPLLCELIGWEKSGNIAGLKKALKRLATTPIEFDLFNRDGKPTWDATAVVAHAGIDGGMCNYEYSTFLAGKLADPEMYSIINVGIQREFKGNYSLSLYENCLRFRGTESGSTGWWPIATWRKVLGADASLYDEFKFLSNKVIKPAVAEINRVSDLIVEPEYQRQGRFVTEIRFIVRENPQRSLLDLNSDVGGVRESETYKLLMDLGVGASLALSMVQKDEKRALEIALYTKERFENGEITGSAGGYIRTLVESNAVVTKPKKEKKAEKPVAASSAGRADEDAKDAQSARSRKAVSTLTDDERAALVAEFIEQTGATSYMVDKGRFRAATESTSFRAFTVKRAPEVIANRA